MINEIWYDDFIKSLSTRYPKKTQLTQALIDLLAIERESVYRRLRKDVSFSVHEIVKIASAWNISLDKITNINAGVVSFRMRPMDYSKLSEQETYYLNYIIQSINNLKRFPDTEFMDVCNELPRSLYAGFRHLYQFFLFKCTYQYGNEEKICPLSQITVSEEEFQLATDYYQTIKQVPNTNFLFDHMIFEHLVSDIEYFHSIRMITDQEKALLKQDLGKLLDYLLEIATKGRYPETQNKVTLYVFLLNIDTNYSYIYTQETKICFVHVFDKYEIHSYDSEMVANFKTWMQLKKRTSIQISEVDERSRIAFFDKQWKLIDRL